MNQMAKDFDWLDTELKRYTYKPGCTFELKPLFDMFTVVVTARVPDSRREVPTDRVVSLPAKDRFDCITGPEMGRPIIPIVGRYPVPSTVIGDPDLFAEWLKSRLSDSEYHELREWFRRDGDLVDDPHKMLAFSDVKVDFKVDFDAMGGAA